MDGVDFEAAYKVEGYGGIAWRLIGYHTYRDEDYEWSGIEEVDRSRVNAVMIGDDRVFTLEVSEVTPISEDEYCPECGQIGCTAYK